MNGSKQITLVVALLAGAAIASFSIVMFGIFKADAARNESIFARENTTTSEAQTATVTDKVEGGDNDSANGSSDADGGASDNPGDRAADEGADEPEGFTVRFLSGSGETLKEERVTNGYAAPPAEPAVESGSVFLGWDKDILNVSGNTVFYPMIEKLEGKPNAVYFDAIYVPAGEEFIAGLSLGGDVDCKKIAVTIEYNPVDLEYVGVENPAEGAKVEHDPDAAAIIFSIDAGEIIGENAGETAARTPADTNHKTGFSQGMTMARLRFKALADDFIYSELNIRSNGIFAVSGASEVPTNSVMYNGKVYILGKR